MVTVIVARSSSRVTDVKPVMDLIIKNLSEWFGRSGRSGRSTHLTHLTLPDPRNL